MPPFEDYSMKGRTYRYFEGTPLYPFGYGLSYTKFSYSGADAYPTDAVAAGSPVVAEVTVTNTGNKAGDEVAQLYLSFPECAGRAAAGAARVPAGASGARRIAESAFELKAA